MKSKPAAPKTKNKPADETAKTGAPKTRRPLKLALIGLASLAVLAGGGYAGWTYALKPAPEAAAPAGEATDPVKVAAVAPQVAAETSFTHSYALSVLIRPTCGSFAVPALKAASDKEALADGMLVSLSWQAAARRTTALLGRSCEYMLNEVAWAEHKAELLAKGEEKEH